MLPVYLPLPWSALFALILTGQTPVLSVFSAALSYLTLFPLPALFLALSFPVQLVFCTPTYTFLLQ